MSTVYYTFNDCITGEPAVIDGNIYFEYIGDGVFNPADLLGKTISSVGVGGTPSEGNVFFGCWTLTKFNGVPTSSIEGWDTIYGYTSSPSCEDCQYRVVGFVNPCVEASDGILFKVLASELSSYLVEDSFYIYNGPPVTSNSGGQLLPGYCYLFGVNDISDPSAGLSIAPAASNFTLSNEDTCFDISCTNVLRDCCTDEILELNGKPLVLTGFPPDEYINKIITALYTEGSVEPEVTGCFKISLGIPYEVEDVIELGWNEVFADTVNTCAECQTCYYEIVNCSNPNEKYCTASNLSMYLNTGIANQAQWPVIQVTQFPGKCFYVQRIETCTAPISITKNPSTPVYTGCAQCLAKQIKYYKLINCNNQSIIVYTSTDLKEYLGKYITLEEYGNDCFYVEVTQDLVPSDTQVTPTGDQFQTCEDCTLPKYLLTDCTGVLDSIVTNTDLSAYVGSVVVIEACPDTCWEVEETDITIADGAVKIIGSPYEDCPECLLATLTSKCVSFVNTTTSSIDFEVLLPDLDTDKVSIAAGATLPKNCYLQWNIPSTIKVIEYGNCVNGDCPPILKPKRKVTPGYDTPACTPEYYENVECTFSEWMYKDVLEKRYGISNCCPEELMKWEIKHEMLMLDALINPDYTCMPPVNCGCPQPTTCNCSCNSGN